MSHIPSSSLSGNIMTPWGMSDHHQKIADGIDYYSTPSHGGFLLAPERQAQIPAPLRLEEDGMAWYEHDSAWLRIAVAFPECFPDHSKEELIRAAKTDLRNWYPDEYEVWTGEKIEAGQSFRRDQALFKAAHEDDYIVIAAETFVMNPTVLICTAVKGGRNIGNGSYSGREKMFLVSYDEYYSGEFCNFIIDSARHPQISQKDVRLLKEKFELFCQENPDARIPIEVKSIEQYCQKNSAFGDFLKSNQAIADTPENKIVVLYRAAGGNGQNERYGYYLVAQSAWRQRNLTEMTTLHPGGILRSGREAHSRGKRVEGIRYKKQYENFPSIAEAAELLGISVLSHALTIGGKDTPGHALGIPGGMDAGVYGMVVTPWFTSMDELNDWCREYMPQIQAVAEMDQWPVQFPWEEDAFRHKKQSISLKPA